MAASINYRHKSHQNENKTRQTHCHCVTNKHYCKTDAATNEFKQFYRIQISDSSCNGLWQIYVYCLAAILSDKPFASKLNCSIAAACSLYLKSLTFCPPFCPEIKELGVRTGIYRHIYVNLKHCDITMDVFSDSARNFFFAQWCHVVFS